LTFIVIGFLAIVVLGVAVSVIGGIIGIISLLLFKVAPLLLIGYFAVKLLRPRQKQLSEEDRKWLES
jgi:hypothetical protein